MPDMLVHLLDLPEDAELEERLRSGGIAVRRALAPDKRLITEWVASHSGPSAAGECEVCFSRVPVSCFVVTRGREILGYACYNATAPDFFGPTRVAQEQQGKGLGKALLLRSLRAMRDEGYVYAIIGGVGPAAFYEKCVGAVLISDSAPGIYRDFLGGGAEPV